MFDPLPRHDWDLEDEVETESLARVGTRITLLTNFSQQGFRASEEFLDGWIKLSVAGRVGTTFGFRQRFCDANHYEVDVPIKGRTRTIRVVELWGLPMVYFFANTPKPELTRIMPQGWHLSKVGRSVRPPPLCRRKP
jgi:hypothetical protein